MICESDDVKFDFMSSFIPDAQPHHISTDIFDRLSRQTQVVVRRMLDDTKKVGATVQAKKFNSLRLRQKIRDDYQRNCLRRTHCMLHPHTLSCPVSLSSCASQDDDSDFEFEGTENFTVSVAGPPCQDASAMNASASGDGGANMAATEVYLQ